MEDQIGALAELLKEMQSQMDQQHDSLMKTLEANTSVRQGLRGKLDISTGSKLATPSSVSSTPSPTSSTPPTSSPTLALFKDDDRANSTISNLVTATSTSPTSSPTSAHSQNAALDFQFGVTKLFIASPTKCSTPVPCLGAHVPVSGNSDSHDCDVPNSSGNDLGSIDHLSRLPDLLLRNIVARLPIKDAARTAALSRRWSPLWRAAPLILVDTHLLVLAENDEISTDHANSDAEAAAVSRILVAHPDPFRGVRLTCCYMEEDRARVEHWLKLLVVKGVQELLLINRPWPPTINKCQVSTIPTTAEYIFSNHSAMVQRYYFMFAVHIQSLRPLPWPPWVFARVFRTWVLWVSSLSHLRPPDTSSSSSKSCMDSSCTLTFDLGILLLSTGIVMSMRLLDNSRDTLNGSCALLLKASTSSATASEGTSFLVCLLSALNLSDYSQNSMLTLTIARTLTAATSVFNYFSVSPVLSVGLDKFCFSTSVCDTREVFESVELCHHCISDMGNDLLNISGTNHRPSNKTPKPPWLLCTAVFSSWSGKMQLVSGFLLEVSPWYLSTIYLSNRPAAQQRVQCNGAWLEMGKACIRSALAISVHVQTTARFTTLLVWWCHNEWIGLLQSSYWREVQWNCCQLFVKGTITDEQSVKLMHD